MGTYSGTYSADTITPDFVSAGVGRNPVGSTPSAAADTINGFGGNDILDGGGGADIINGGEGSDTIAFSAAGGLVHGNAGDDEITVTPDLVTAEDVSNAVYGDAGNDQIDFGYEPTNEVTLSGVVSLHGGDGNDDLDVWAYSYASELINFGTTRFEQFGEAGDDMLHAMDYVYMETGNYGAADDYLYGGPGNDTYMLEEKADVVVEKPGEGYDTVIGYADDYTLAANVEKLVVIGSIDDGGWYSSGTGNALDNVIVGDGRGDQLGGAGGNDTIFGNNGWVDYDDADTIHGGTGNDLIYGGSGSDADTWDGDDLLYGDDGNDRIFGSYGDDQMYGGTGADELGGQAGNDTMYGGAGNDKLGGGSGDDWLYGEGDADVLSGRGDLDHLSGGLGNDIFDYDAVTDSKGALRDVILDFAGVGAAAGDRIDLSTIDANATAGGNQAFKFVGKAGFSGPGQVRVVASGADTLIQVNTDANKATVEMDILVKDGTATPTQWVAGDFIL